MINSRQIFEDPNITDFNLTVIQASACQWMRWIEFNLVLPGGILALDAGLGKTHTYCSLIEASPQDFNIIVCPLQTQKHVIEVLSTVAKRFSIFLIDGDYYSLVTIDETNGQLKKSKLREKQGQGISSRSVLVINPDLFNSKFSLIKKTYWNRLIIDEAHDLRNGTDTAFYNNILNLPQPSINVNGFQVNVGSRFCVTATPIQNSRKELVNIFNCIKKNLIPEKYNIQLLEDLLNNFCYKISKENLVPELKKMIAYPENEPIFNYVDFEYPITELSEYVKTLTYLDIEREFHTNQQFHDDFLYDERAYIIGIISKIYFNSNNHQPNIIQFQSILSNPFEEVLFSEPFKGIDSRTNKVLEILNENQHKSFVIVVNYIKSKKNLERTITNNFPNFKLFELEGSISNDKRSDSIESFNINNNNKIPSILITTSGVGSVGLNLQSCSNMILFDQHPNPQEELQTFARIHRMGQVEQTFIWVLSNGNIQTYYGTVSTDKRIETIKNEKLIETRILETSNAAFYFRKYRTIINGVTTTGITFGDIDYNIQHAKLLVGPLEIY